MRKHPNLIAPPDTHAFSLVVIGRHFNHSQNQSVLVGIDRILVGICLVLVYLGCSKTCFYQQWCPSRSVTSGSILSEFARGDLCCMLIVSRCINPLPHIIEKLSSLINSPPDSQSRHPLNNSHFSCPSCR